MTYKVLTIAGSDPSGGAGIQADLKTFSALGCYGMSVITALTAQNTMGVQGVYPIPHEFLTQQLRSIFEDIEVNAVKIGMLGDRKSVLAIANILKEFKAKNIVLDPVMVAQSGDPLIDAEVIDTMKEKLFPISTLITPNLPEAEILLGHEIYDPVEAAKALLKTGAQAVLLKGGHGAGEAALDVLATPDDLESFTAKRHATKNTHGTGCTLSSALACFLARGFSMENAVRESKNYITRCIKQADDLSIGKGAGPVHHFHGWWDS